MAHNLTRPSALLEAGLIEAQTMSDLEAVAQKYAIAITPEIAALIDSTDPFDPIAHQFVPDVRELNILKTENADPIDDAGFSPLKGLVHRYKDRVLLKVVSVCPVYCRFCFRREMVGPGGEAMSEADLDAAIDYIAARSDIFEVIMTGGDPFMMSPRRMHTLTTRLAKIAHVKILRWHTRVPMVDSARITDDLVAALTHKDVATWVAVHANHAREFTPAATAALARLVDGGVALVSQSVLLKGVNDTVAALSDLMRAFLSNRVKPYYLHHPDLAPGTSHFRLSIREGQELMRSLRTQISGLAQPTYVLDVPAGATKAPLMGAYVQTSGEGLQVLSGDGAWLDYKG